MKLVWPIKKFLTEPKILTFLDRLVANLFSFFWKESKSKFIRLSYEKKILNLLPESSLSLYVDDDKNQVNYSAKAGIIF